MSSPLVDREGFPISGIDIIAIRSARHRIHVLINDRAEVNAKLTELLSIALPEHNANSTLRSGHHMVNAYDDEHNLAPPQAAARPIAVRSVTPGSPASQAGLCAGDTVFSFGDIRPLSSARFQELPSRVQEGVPISMEIQRTSPQGQREMLQLVLTPSSSWNGRGMLGCHLVVA
ncbi:Nas2p [Malassezia vespertilionis]|uniref:Probable 26S proteasome regulatory subunit p27 n=1 Tax=Malassezia vespertilionis TaxID=2020962 RepID=A0A2N1JBW3_9BASI|nr:Nas2p [Malassezia vespertilionis]